MTPAESGPSKAGDELYYIVARLSRAMNRAVDDIAFRNGITLAEFTVMLVLGEGAPITSAQLARRAFVTPQASHQVVTSLLTRGLAQSEDDPSDGRLKLVTLSPEGYTVLAALRTDLRDVQSRAMADLSAADRRRFPMLLRTLADTLRGGWFGDDEAAALAASHRTRGKRPPNPAEPPPARKERA